MDLRGIRGRYLTSRPEPAKISNKKKICGTCLCHRGDEQSESEGDVGDAGGVIIEINDAAGYENEEEGAQEFSAKHAPYVAVVRDVVQPNYSLRTCIPTHTT